MRPDARDVIDPRDTAYQISCNFDLLYVVAKEALEFETARQSELLAVSSHQTSVSAHRLNTLAGFFRW